MCLMLALLLILAFPLKKCGKKFYHYGCVFQEGLRGNHSLSVSGDTRVSHVFDSTTMSNLPDFNRITQVFKIKLCCRGLWDYRTRKIGCVASH